MSGLVNWAGGHCPVPAHVMVEVELRNQARLIDRADAIAWGRRAYELPAVKAWRVADTSGWVAVDGSPGTTWTQSSAVAFVTARCRNGEYVSGQVNSLRWTHTVSSDDLVSYYWRQPGDKFADVTADRPPEVRVTLSVDVTDAIAALEAAAKHMRDRAATYDQPGGERSMARTVQAFNAITGRDISESEGWMFMAVLKFVRDRTTAAGHADSQEDAIAYASLMAEARRKGL